VLYFQAGDDIHQAVKKGDMEGLKGLVDGGVDVNDTTSKGKQTPLHVAALEGHAKIAEYLLDHGAELEAKDSEGSSPLLEAVRGGHLEVIKLLLQRGADIHTAGSNQKTLLHVAAFHGHKQVVEYLADSGANIHATDKYFQTPLYVAASSGNLEVLDYLVSKRANMHKAINWHHWSPLHAAASSNHMEVVKYLVTHGADLEARNREGKRPIDLAKTDCIRTYLQNEMDAVRKNFEFLCRRIFLDSRPSN